MPRKVRIRLPTMALASPPPSLPGPGVTCVKTRGAKAVKPCQVSIPRIQPSTKTPSAAKAAQTIFIARSATWRCRRTRPQGISASVVGRVAGTVVMPQLRSVNLDPRHQEARHDQHPEGDEEQDAAERDQGVELHPDRLVELIGDPRRDGRAGVEDGAGKAVGVADDEGDGHGLAERAPEPEHDCADDGDAG